jgi:phosphopantothenoylcysteine decarboxylase / phosphopantothenate---cysteine ligase
MSLIALGVTGGISAYKAVEIARGLQERGHDIAAIMTRSARHFVGPITFEAITRRRVITGQFVSGANADIEHIALASAIDLLLVAPATANIIGKMANGIADDFLSSLYLATRAPVLIAPAMNTNMWEHDAVQRNLAVLAARGVRQVPPGEGFLACGWTGKGRLADVADVVAAADAMVRRGSSLRGRRLVVTAGPTCEDLDPVRFIGNRSSGRMGFALASEAARRGASVTLISGPVTLVPPAVDSLVEVRSAADMHAAVVAAAPGADAVIMAAAVADYSPELRETSKIEKSGSESLRLVLRRTVDILADLGRRREYGELAGTLLVGFAAETSDAAGRARRKLQAKKIDMIVANDVSQPGAGFDVDTNAVTIIARDGEKSVPMSSKAVVAAVILDEVEALLADRTGAAGVTP